MGKPIRLAVLLALFLPGAARRAEASFETAPAGARAAAMGGASLAGRGDSSTLFLNPAPLAALERPEGYFMYNRFYAGLRGVGSLNQGFISFGVPFKGGALGLGYGDLLASGLLEERIVGLAYARKVYGSLEAGVTGKYLHHRFLIASDPSAAGDPVFAAGASRGAFTLDFGVSGPVAGALRAGAAVRNLNGPDVGLESEDRVSREFQGGLSCDFPRGYKVTADYLYRDRPSGTLSDRSVPGLGLEKSLEGGGVKFRLGVTPDQLSGGAGMQFDHLGFDYAFVLSRFLLSDNAGTHMIAVRYRFGAPR